MKLELPEVTLIGADCNHLDKLILAADICESYCDFGAVKLLTSAPSRDPRTIKIPEIKSTRQYSYFMIKRLASYVDTEFALVFQYDGFVLNPKAWDNSFLKYDYIGAPWTHLSTAEVGNGGFSLRSKRLLDFLARNHKRIGGSLHPEDIWISRKARPYIEKHGMIFAPTEVAERFSKEGNSSSISWNGEFGFHGIKYTDISRWLDKNPKYKQHLRYKLDDFASLQKAYEERGKKIYIFRHRKGNINDFVALSRESGGVLARQDMPGDKKIKAGDTILFKRSGIPIDELNVPAFSKKVAKVEHFPNAKKLLESHPEATIARHHPSPHDLMYTANPMSLFWISHFGKKSDRKKPHSLYWFD